MPEVKMVDLPSIGKKFTIELANGDKLIIVIHFSGEREIFKLPKGSEESEFVIRFSDKEAHQVGAILTGTYFQPVAEAESSVTMRNISMEWITITSDSTLVGKKIKETGIQKDSGVSIIAIIRGGAVIPNPSTDEVIRDQDMLVVIGIGEQVKKFMSVYNTQQFSQRC